jgi:large subunit ribosomal protein L23
MKPYYEVLIGPYNTEKNDNKQVKLNQYTFRVDKNANKIDITKAVEEAFDLKNKVLSVNTITCRGKFKRVGRYTGKRPDWKKAIVTLVKGASIPQMAKESA